MSKQLSRSIPKALTFLGLFSLFATLLAKASVIVGLYATARISQMI